jgi:hypothetical protein
VVKIKSILLFVLDLIFGLSILQKELTNSSLLTIIQHFLVLLILAKQKAEFASCGCSSFNLLFFWRCYLVGRVLINKFSLYSFLWVWVMFRSSLFIWILFLMTGKSLDHILKESFKHRLHLNLLIINSFKFKR